MYIAYQGNVFIENRNQTFLIILSKTQMLVAKLIVHIVTIIHNREEVKRLFSVITTPTEKRQTFQCSPFMLNTEVFLWFDSSSFYFFQFLPLSRECDRQSVQLEMDCLIIDKVELQIMSLAKKRSAAFDYGIAYYKIYLSKAAEHFFS